MLARDRQTNQFKKVYVKALDSLPVGSEIDFDGQASDIPVGWEETTNPDSYSTDEVKTNKTWFGKPVYRKCFSGTTAVAGATGTLSMTTLTITAIDKITFFGGNINNNGILFYVPAPPFESSYGNVVRLIKNGTNTIRLDCSSNLSEKNYEIAVEYTKTTD